MFALLLCVAGWALAKQHQEVDDLGVTVEKAAAAAAAAGSNAAAGRDLGDIDADLQAAESQLKHAEIGRDDLVKRHSKIKVRPRSDRGGGCKKPGVGGARGGGGGMRAVER